MVATMTKTETKMVAITKKTGEVDIKETSDGRKKGG